MINDHVPPEPGAMLRQISERLSVEQAARESLGPPPDDAEPESWWLPWWRGGLVVVAAGTAMVGLWKVLWR